jgi:iron complex outermembrane receptor protein
MKQLLFSVFLLPFFLQANEISIEEDFLASLEEVSEIASKSKLNIDDMPSFVTILHSSKLELLGIQDIYEALCLVPGVEISMEGSGARQIIFRGVQEKGEVKLLFDGVAINNTYRGSIYYYLDFPIELIDRIEVIRGPGSVLYGSNAISGVINIITKNMKQISPNRLFATLATPLVYKAGFNYGYALADTTHLRVDGYYQNQDYSIDAGPDKAMKYDQSDESKQDYAVGFQLDSDQFSLLARLKRSQMGMHFGIGNYFESKNDKKGNINQSLLLEAGYKNDLNKDTYYKLSIGANYYAQEIDTRFLTHPSRGDLIYYGDYAENSYYADGTLNSTSIENHTLVIGTRYEYSESKKTSLETYFEQTGDPYLPTENLIKPDRHRDIFSLYLNDSMALADAVDLVAGVRWDHYSDFGNALSPRLGIIWRAYNELNFKMLYSRSFRAPSWVELYADITGISIGNPDLEAEIADTIELGSVYRPSSKQKLRLNLYATQIDNLISRTASVYDQEAKNSYLGAELEWMLSLIYESDLKMRLSYVDGVDEDNKALPEIANFLANVSYLHRFDSGFSSGSVLKYVGPRQRASDDPRDALDGYALFDQTFSYHYDHLTLSLIVKNLFDTQYEDPAPLDTYVNDYPRQGRSAWLSFKGEF